MSVANHSVDSMVTSSSWSKLFVAMSYEYLITFCRRGGKLNGVSEAMGRLSSATMNASEPCVSLMIEYWRPGASMYYPSGMSSSEALDVMKVDAYTS